MSTEDYASPGGRGRQGTGRVQDLRGDERGAILVLGIFMCSCIVGALWYLAGIGSAIVYRERMQEAADAIAFSGAVLHARGMNLIVLINFIMAAILAIRVALRVTQFALVVVGTVLSLIPFVGAGLAAPFFSTATSLESPINAVRQPINNALKGLSRVQVAIARIVPPAALLGSGQVGDRYQPVLSTGAADVILNRAASPIAVADGLPVEEDTETKLCEKAGEAVGSVLTMAVPIPEDLADAISGMFGRLVAAGGAYFCEMGSGGGAPDVSNDLNQGAEDACDQELERLEREASDARRRYNDACTAYDCLNVTPTPAQQIELDGLARDRDIKDQAVRDFDRDQCVEDKRREGREEFNRRTGGGSSAPSGNGQGMTPKKVKNGWKNGIRDAQVISVVNGRLDSLRVAERGARVGSWATPITFRTPTSASYALAQAEFFFDCRGAWTSSDCNDRNEAMWRFRWRARLRRFNSPFEALDSVVTLALTAETYRDAISGYGSTGFQNAALQLELSTMVLRRFTARETIIH